MNYYAASPQWPYPPHSPWSYHQPYSPQALQQQWDHPPSPWAHLPAWPADPRLHQAHLWPWQDGHGWGASPFAPAFPRLQNTDSMYRPADFPDNDLPPLVDPNRPPWEMMPFRQPTTPMYNPPAPPPPPPPLANTPAQPQSQPMAMVFVTRFDRANPPPRPSEWRRDYVPPGRWKGLSMLRRAERNPPPLEPCHLTHTLLMPNDKTPVLSLDLRSELPLLDPLTSRLELLTTTTSREPNDTDLLQLATYFPVQRLRITHEYLPWIIDIHADTSPSNGVLVKDVLEQLRTFLQTPITPDDFYNRVLSAEDRECISDAYTARAAGRVDIMQRGVSKVDYLGAECVLSGFVEGRRGVWEMKTRSF